MPYDGAMRKAFSMLSPEQQSMVYQYVLFLVDRPPEELTIQEEHPHKRKLGPLADRFQGISEDFNDPLF